MTIIAWDGKTLAMDKQATANGLRRKTTKFRRLASGEILTWTGDQDSGEAVARWYEQGADPEKWPACQRDKDDWARLIVASRKGVKFFERQPIAVRVEDRFSAWGSGRDFAIGAMARGATAIEAVKVAMRFDAGCGLGVDSVKLR